MNNKTIFIVTLSLGLLFQSCKKEVTTNTNTEIVSDESQNNQTDLETKIESKNDNPKAGKAEMTFEKKEHDFGVIKPDSKVDYTFKFKNTGKEDLVISNAHGSCGCTVPEYPKEAIKPGENGEIKVSFNSAGKSGKQEKSVTLYANTPAGNELLKIKALIK